MITYSNFHTYFVLVLIVLQYHFLPSFFLFSLFESNVLPLLLLKVEPYIVLNIHSTVPDFNRGTL